MRNHDIDVAHSSARPTMDGPNNDLLAALMTLNTRPDTTTQAALYPVCHQGGTTPAPSQPEGDANLLHQANNIVSVGPTAMHKFARLAHLFSAFFSNSCHQGVFNLNCVDDSELNCIRTWQGIAVGDCG